jgi:hypothetical protein
MPSLCPPLYEPTRPVSSSRRDQTEDATLRSSRVSCVPGHPIHLQMQGTALLVQMMRKPGLQLTRTGRDPHYDTE